MKLLFLFRNHIKIKSRSFLNDFSGLKYDFKHFLLIASNDLAFLTNFINPNFGQHSF